MTDSAQQAAEASIAAANAANANAAYRAANNLPADATNTTILSNPYNQIYLAQQDAANQAAKYAAAIAQPRNDVRVAPQAALDAYAQQRSNSIGSGGQQAQGPAAHAQFIQQPGYVQNPIGPQYDRGGNPINQQAVDEVAARGGQNGLKTPSNYTGYGDTQTGKIVNGLEASRAALANMGIQFQDRNALTGSVIELQRDQAYRTPTQTDDRFFNNQLQLWSKDFVTKASEYHHTTLASGKQDPANPFEYQGDLAVEFLKGAPTKPSEVFSPVSGLMSQYLPGGLGVQQDAWNRAISYDRGEPYNTQVSFAPAVGFLNSAQGKYGPYGKLFGGIDNGYGLPQSVIPQAQSLIPQNGGLTPSYNGLEFTSIAKMGPASLPANNGNMNLPQGYGGFGVMAANEGTLINPDYSSRMSVESGMNYGVIPKPFISTSGVEPKSNIPFLNADQGNRLQSVFQEYGHATDITTDFLATITGAKIISGIGNAASGGRLPPASFTPFADQNQWTGLGADNPLLVQANTKIGAANNIARNSWSDLDTQYGTYLNDKGATLQSRSDALQARNDALTSESAKNVKGGYWIGSPESLKVFNDKVAALNTESGLLKSEFSNYSKETTGYNARADVSKQLYADAGLVRQGAVANGAYVVREGRIVENPDMKRPYGAASDWGQGASDYLTSKIGISREQFANYDTVIKNQPPVAVNPEYGIFGGLIAGEQQKTRNLENDIYGFNKEIYTNPEGLTASAISGLQLSLLASGAGGVIEGVAAREGVGSGAAVMAQRIGSNPVVQYGVPTVLVGSGVWDATKGFTLSASEASMNTGQMGSHFAAMGVGGFAPEGLRSTVGYGEVRFAVKPESRLDAQVVESGVVQPNHGGGEAQINYRADYTVSELPHYNIMGHDVVFPRLSNLRETERGTIQSPNAIVIDNVQGFGLARDPNAGMISPSVWSRESSIQVNEFRGDLLARGSVETTVGGLTANRGVESYYNDAVTQAKAQRATTGSPNTQAILDIAQSTALNDILLAEPRTAYRNYNLASERGIGVPRTISEMLNVPTRGGIETTYQMGAVSPFDYINRVQVGRTGSNLRENYNSWVERTSPTEAMYSTDMSARRATVNDLQREAALNPTNEFGKVYDQYGNAIARMEGTPTSANIPYTEAGANIALGESISGAHYHPNVGFSIRELGNSVGLDVWDVLTTTRTAGEVVRSSTTQAYLLSKSPGSMYYETPSLADLRNDVISPREVSTQYIGNREGTFVYEQPPNRGWGNIQQAINGIGDPLYQYYGMGNKNAMRWGGVNEIRELELAGSRTEYIPNDVVYRTGEETKTITGNDISARMQESLPEFMGTGIRNAADRMVLNNQLLEFETPLQPQVRRGYVGGRGIEVSSANTIGGSQSQQLQATPISDRRYAGSNTGLSAVEPKLQTGPKEQLRGFDIGSSDRNTGKLSERYASSQMILPIAGILSNTMQSQSSASLSAQMISPMSLSGQRQIQPQQVEYVRAFDIKSDVMNVQDQRQEKEQLRAYMMGSDVARVPRVDQSIESIPMVGYRSAQATASMQEQRTQPMQEIKPIQTTEPRLQQFQREIIPGREDTPVPLLRFGSLPGGGGGGGGSRNRKRRKVELFSFEIGQDTPIPTRYGLAGQTTDYVPGVRGIAAEILPAGDIAPNNLFGISRRTQGDRL